MPRLPLFALVLGFPITLVCATTLHGQAVAPNVITSCVSKTTGVTRIVSNAGNCNSNENLVTWNQQGPQGVQGTQGAQGLQGVQGPSGPTGSAGPTSLSSNLTFSGTLSNALQAIGPISGISPAMEFNGTNVLADVLDVPGACSTLSITSTLYDAPANGGSFLVVVPYLLSDDTTQVDLQCQITLPTGATTGSCSSNNVVKKQELRRYVGIQAGAVTLNNLKGAHLITDVKCQ